MTETPPRRRAGGREARRAAREENTAGSSTPYLTRMIPPYEIISEDDLALIENNADIILEEVGIDFRDYPSSLELLKNAGAKIDGERVRFPKGMCREIITRSAPSTYVQHARNPSKSVLIGGNATVLVPAYGSPFVFDLDNGRRYANIEDFRNFVKLAYMTPHLHHSGGTVVEPVDIPVSKRHLDMVYSHLKFSDKPFMGSVTAPERAEDSVALAEMVFGKDFLAENTVITSLINASSPMCWDATMLGAAEAYARANQATVISPFIVAGAMAPVTVAGVAAQTLAEALAGMAFIQLVNPGAPTVFGSFAMSMSMQTGAPTFGTPEPALMLYTMAALARRLGVPFRSGGNLCASKIPDAQAASESISTFIPAILGGVNFMLHSAGWLEGGLSMGYEKFIIDADQCGLAANLVKGVDLSENGQALDAIKETGPGQHFLGSEHTLANFETAFAVSEIANNDSYEQWSEEGSLDSAQRANSIWKKMLNNYEPPPLEESIDEAMLDFIAKRKSELPDEFA